MELAFINLSTWEIVGIVAIGILLFGSRLPSIARSLGKSVTEFKKGVKDLKDEMDADEPKKIEDRSREVQTHKVEEKETEKVS
ncbi:MAG: twin-arginine translocase TatA/TatE family subunit [Planctomycetes bacterium]|nr:twin-arginine translocase TatA/TatE family subunit [Planctomycetota bacterium]MCB9935183.1 twin-arginine translocase TatA/TatE family subunit [Planctomycetota bacterium]